MLRSILPGIRPRVRDWRVRTRLAAVLVLPAVAFAVVAGAQAVQAVRDAAAGDAFARRVTAAQAGADLIHRLQHERDLGGTFSTPADRAAAALTTDIAARGWDDAARTAELVLPEAVRALPRQLPAVRAGQPHDAGYSRVIDALIMQLDLTAVGVTDTRAAAVAGVTAELARAKEATSRLRAFGYAQQSLPGVDIGQRIALLRQARADAAARFRAAATRLAGTDAPAVQPPAATELDALADQLPTGVVEPARWWATATAEMDSWRASEVALDDWQQTRAQQRITTASGTAVAVVIAVLLVLLLTVTLSVLVGRSMIGPLRDLRNRALSVAHVELPQTLAALRAAGARELLPELPAASPQTAADEIGEVAAAFDAVHHNAVELALRQTRSRHTLNSIFVNLARRSQVLVERQLRLLDDMERDERDPDRLAALFRLDHLAARLRRNDENLLVLAGAEPRRRWRQGVPLAALALAGLAEIEQYERVRADVDESLFVAGHVAADVVHLLAELLDNATTFSAPSTPVQVTSRAGTDGAMLEILDEGIGLNPEVLAELNALLAAPPEVDVAASERMGLVVVSHLAARHGIRVQLFSYQSGVCVTVRLPAQLLTEPPAPEEPLTPARPARGTPIVASTVRGATPNSSTPDMPGLPVRVPSTPRSGRKRTSEPDPAATAAILTRLYDGVRRGQASAVDDTADIKGESP